MDELFLNLTRHRTRGLLRRIKSPFKVLNICGDTYEVCDFSEVYEKRNDEQVLDSDKFRRTFWCRAECELEVGGVYNGSLSHHPGLSMRHGLPMLSEVVRVPPEDYIDNFIPDEPTFKIVKKRGRRKGS